MRLYIDVDSVRADEWTPEITKAVKGRRVERIYTEDISKVPAGYRIAAVLGFVSELPADLTSRRAETHMAFLKRNAGKLSGIAMEHSDLLYFLLEQKLIMAKDMDFYIEEANKQDNTEAIVALLNYQNELGLDKMSKAREMKTKKTDQVFDRKLVRTQRAPEYGIAGLTFVITGNLSSFWTSRKEVKEYLEFYGAKLGSGVTAKTDYLVTNDVDSTSEKAKKAKELGVEVISEKEFNLMVCRYFKDAEHITVPSWVRMIGAHAFEGFKRLTSVTLPEGLQSVEEKAFFECKRLTSITLPDKLQSIGAYAFDGCKRLTSVTLPDGLQNIGDQAFYDCKGLANADGMVIVNGILFDYYGSGGDVIVPEGVTDIGADAFYYCGKLKSIMLPAGVKTIGIGAFSECARLKSVTLKEGLKSIGNSAFWLCDNLRSVTLPKGLTSIGDGVCEGCYSMKNISLPESLTSIGSRAFSGCDNLTIHAPAGSYAEQYAKENNIPFVAE